VPILDTVVGKRKEISKIVWESGRQPPYQAGLKIGCK
jgi:hypothetical protein